MHKPQLFLLHFAGGSIYSYQFLRSFLPEFDFIPLELPGRGKRIRERLIKDFNQAADDIYRQLVGQLQPRPFLIYGHSMGSLLALQVAALLEKTNQSPMAIIVSGNAGPGTREGKKRYLLEKNAFKAEMKAIGGMPDEVLENEELLEYFEPMLKADFEVVEKDFSDYILKVNVPIYAVMGTEEEQNDHINDWMNYTTSGFAYELLEGNHFFILRHPEKMAGIIKKCYYNEQYEKNYRR